MSFHKTKSAHAHQVRRALLKRGAAHKLGFDVVEVFADVADILDPDAFRERLEAVRRIEMSGRGLRAKHLPMRQGWRTPLGLGRVREVLSPAQTQPLVHSQPQPETALALAPDLAATTRAALAAMPELSALLAPQAWAPSERQLALGQRLKQAILAQPDQDTVKAFAARVGKSASAVYKRIEQRKLLSLRLSEREQRVPNWQSDYSVRAMVGQALCDHPELDTWTAYQAFIAPVGVLGGLNLVQACQQGLHPLERLLTIFRAELGLQPRPTVEDTRQGA